MVSVRLGIRVMRYCCGVCSSGPSLPHNVDKQCGVQYTVYCLFVCNHVRKIFCKRYLPHRLTEGNEIWQCVRAGRVADLQPFGELWTMLVAWLLGANLTVG